MEKILVLDFGGQYNQLIARRVRDHHIYAEILPYTTPLSVIRENGYKGIIFTGGPNDNELINYISSGRFLNLAGKTDIIELMELFSRADLVIAPDSGSAHLAWAARKPAVITIFTCTPKDVLAPYGNNSKYIALGGEGLSCQPCFKRKCHLRKNIDACTNFPSPSEVLKVIDSLIF